MSNKVTLSKPMTHVYYVNRSFFVRAIVGFSIFCTHRLNFNFSVAARLQPRSLTDPFVSIMTRFPCRPHSEMKGSVQTKIIKFHYLASPLQLRRSVLSLEDVNVDSKASSLVI